MDLEEALGFVPALPSLTPEPGDVRRTVFRAKKLLAGLVYHAAALEGSPYTFPEVQTLIDGVTVGGHRLEDERLILNLRRAWDLLFSLVLPGQFLLDKETFCRLHAQVALEESVTWGAFRTGAVEVAGPVHYTAPPADKLEFLFERGLKALGALGNPYHRALNFFLFGTYHQFFFAGNKRTSRLMMNGELLRLGMDVINIPATRRLEFNEKMGRFYDFRDGAEMGSFLLSLRLPPI